jgi:hypothetical protein
VLHLIFLIRKSFGQGVSKEVVGQRNLSADHLFHHVKNVGRLSLKKRPSHEKKAQSAGSSDSLDFMTSPSRQMLPRTIASTLLFVEGAVVLALGAWMIFFGFTHENREILPLLGVVLFAIAGGLGLIECGRGYKAGRNYGKAPAVLANLIALGVVKYQAEAGLYYVAIPIALLAVATLFTVLKIASQENKSK